MSIYTGELKSYLNSLKKIDNVPKYARGFNHTIKSLTYLDDVVSGKINRSQLMIKACDNSLNDLMTSLNTANSKWKYDPVRAEKPCFFIETFKHVKGKWADSYIILEPWQCDIICNLFGWVDCDSELRRYIESYLEIPRKNGKTVTAAGSALYMLFGDGEHGAEVYCGAKSKQQAFEVFSPARLMVKRNIPLQNRFNPDVKIESITLPDGSKFLPIIGKAQDGTSPSFTVLDEIHQHPDGSLYECQQTGLGSRDQPMIFMITTAGFDLLSFCKAKHDENVDMIWGIVPDDRHFARIYSIDDDDLEKIRNPLDFPEEERDEIDKVNLSIIEKANPNFGVSLKTDYLLQQCHSAFKSPEDRAKFLTKHLNCWVNSAKNYFSIDALSKCIDTSLNINDFKNDLCVITVDLASKLDLACILVAFARVINGEIHYYVFPEFYLPEDTVNDVSNKNYQRYETFRKTVNNNTSCGIILNVCDGCETNYLSMTETIGSQAEIYSPKEVIFDSYNALQMEQQCERDFGLNVVEYSKTTAYFSPAMKEMKSAMLAGRFHYDGNICLGWNIQNVESKEDKNGNDFPRKANLRAENKIDGAICCLMAIGRLMILSQQGDANEHYQEIYANY